MERLRLRCRQRAWRVLADAARDPCNFVLPQRGLHVLCVVYEERVQDRCLVSPVRPHRAGDARQTVISVPDGDYIAGQWGGPRCRGSSLRRPIGSCKSLRIDPQTPEKLGVMVELWRCVANYRLHNVLPLMAMER